MHLSYQASFDGKKRFLILAYYKFFFQCCFLVKKSKVLKRKTENGSKSIVSTDIVSMPIMNTVLSVWNTSVNKTDTNSCPWGAYVCLEKTDDNEDNKLCVRR